MEEPEVPNKRRKTEEGEEFRNRNDVLPPTAKKFASPADKKAAAADTRSPLQVAPKVLERLRQITKDCKKTFGVPKDDNSPEKQTQETIENGISLKQNRVERGDSDDDVIISSVGSSPAHSPKPTDLLVLSTPPKKSTPVQPLLDSSRDVSSGAQKKVAIKLVDIFDDNMPSVESRKRKFEEVAHNSQTADNSTKKKESDTEADINKCNGNTKSICNTALNNGENVSTVSDSSGEVSKRQVQQSQVSSLCNPSNENSKREKVDNGSTNGNLFKKNPEIVDQQRTSPRGEIRGSESQKQMQKTNESSAKDQLTKETRQNEFDEQKTAETTGKDQLVDSIRVQPRDDVSLNKEKDKGDLPPRKQLAQNFSRNEQVVSRRNLDKTSAPRGEERNEESPRRTGSEGVGQLRSGQQRNQSRNTRSEFNSYEFKEALKTLVSERMREMQKAFIGTTETVKLKSRIENLECENRELHSYTRRLEETVKDMLSKQKRKLEGRTCKGVQTEDRGDSSVLGAAKTRTPPITRPSTTAASESSVTSTPRLPSSVLPQTARSVAGTQTHHFPGKHVQPRAPGQPVTQQSQVATGARVPQLVSQAVSHGQPYPSHGSASGQTVSPPVLHNAGAMAASRPAPVTVTVHPQPPTLVSAASSRPPPPYDSPRVVYTSVRPQAPHQGLQVVYTMARPIHSAEPTMQISHARTLVRPQGPSQGSPQVAPPQRINISPGGPHSQPPPLVPPPLASGVMVQPSRAPQPGDPRFVQSNPARSIQSIPQRPEMIIERRPSPQGPYHFQGPPQGPQQGMPRGPSQSLQQGVPRGPSQGLQQGVPRGPSQGLQQGVPRGPSQGLQQGMPRGPSQGLQQGVPRGPSQGLQQGVPLGPSQGLQQGVPRGPVHIPQQGTIRGPRPTSVQTPVAVRGPPMGISQGPPQQQGPPRGPPQTFQQGPPQGLLQAPRAPPLVRPPPHVHRPVSAEQRVTPPAIEVSPTATERPAEVQSPLEAANTIGELPPKPTVSIAVVMSGIVLSWNMRVEDNCAQIVSYQLFALQDNSNSTQPNQWKKIGVVKALPLPMACTLTQFLSGNKYHFMVRAVDKYSRTGNFSDPCTITLK